MNFWSKKLFTIAAMAALLCLAGLVMSDDAQAQRFVNNGNGTVTDLQIGTMWTKQPIPVGEVAWY